MKQAIAMRGTRKPVAFFTAGVGPARLSQIILFLLRRMLGLVLVVVTVVPAAAQSPELHRAVEAGDLDGLTRLLATGVDVNARDNRGRTALMYAVEEGYVLLVEPLLAAQTDPNVRAPDGATALFMAAVHGYSEIIPMLMKAGADPTIRGPRGKTTTEIAQERYGDLMTALKNGEPPAVIALLAGKTLPEGEELVRIWMPGSIIRDCDQCPDLVVVIPGRFRDDLAGDGDIDELPERAQMDGLAKDGDIHRRRIHEVTIEYPFAVGKYEVTFAEWDACVANGGCTHRPDDRGWGRGPRPVINVSWDDAQEYVAWLSRETGKAYRLLSEAEWEYVSRAGTTTAYWWVNEADHDYANYGTDKCCEGIAAGADRWEHTFPVGSFEPNAFGLFDTAGNVWEWVEDYWQDSYREARTSGDCSLRVVRGGSWRLSEEPVLCVPRQVRHRLRLDFVGFRVTRMLIP